MNRELSNLTMTLVSMLILATTIGIFFYTSGQQTETAEGMIDGVNSNVEAQDLADWMQYNKTTISGSKVFTLANIYKDSNITIAIKAPRSDRTIVIGYPIENGTFDGHRYLAEQSASRVESISGNLYNELNDVSLLTQSPYFVNIEALYTTYLIRDSITDMIIGIYILPIEG